MVSCAQVLHSASAAYLYKIGGDGATVPLGPAGLAILGARGPAPPQRQLLLYDAAKRPHVQEAVGPSFALVPQENLYFYFYAADGGCWSTLMKSAADWEARRSQPLAAAYAILRASGPCSERRRAAAQALARAVLLARCCASAGSAAPAVVCQDVALGDPAGMTVEPGDTVQARRPAPARPVCPAPGNTPISSLLAQCRVLLP